MKSRSSLQEFVAVILDFKALGPYLVLGTTAVPLLDIALHAGPAWPEGFVFLTCLVSAFGHLCGFNLMHNLPQGKLLKATRIAAISLVATSLLYLALWSTLTINVGPGQNRIATGFQASEVANRELEAAALLPSPDSPSTVSGLLNVKIANNADTRPPSDKVLDCYVPWTVHAVRLALLFIWTGAFFEFALFAMAFTLYHRRRSVSPGRVLRQVKKQHEAAAPTTGETEKT